MPRPLLVALTAVPAAFLVVFYAWPFATLLARGLSPEAIGEVLGRRATWEVVWFTVWQAVASTVLTVAIGLVPAYVMARFRFPGRRTLGALLTSASVLSVFCSPLRASSLPTYRDTHAPISGRVADLLSRMTLEEKVAQLAG